MFNYNVNVPVSRFRREPKTWMRFIEKNPEITVFLTKNNKVIISAISPQQYKKLNLALKEK